MVAAVVALGLLLAPAGASRLPSTATADAILGLTPEAEWPLQDAWLATLGGTLDGGALEAEVAGRLGVPEGVARIELNRRNGGARSTLTITATASTSEEAAGFANGVAEAMLAAAPAEAPVAFLNRADALDEDAGKSAIAGGVVGLLTGLALVPSLDRFFGRLRSTNHFEFAGRVGRWVDPSGPKKDLLPLEGRDQRLAAALRGLAGPIAVVSTQSPHLATDVAKALSSELLVDVVDGGAVDQPEAARAVVDSVSVVVATPKSTTRRRDLDRVLRRLDRLGAQTPAVVLVGERRRQPQE